MVPDRWEDGGLIKEQELTSFVLGEGKLEEYLEEFPGEQELSR